MLLGDKNEITESHEVQDYLSKMVEDAGPKSWLSKFPYECCTDFCVPKTQAHIRISWSDDALLKSTFSIVKQCRFHASVTPFGTQSQKNNS